MPPKCPNPVPLKLCTHFAILLFPEYIFPEMSSLMNFPPCVPLPPFPTSQWRCGENDNPIVVKFMPWHVLPFLHAPYFLFISNDMLHLVPHLVPHLMPHLMTHMVPHLKTYDYFFFISKICYRYFVFPNPLFFPVRWFPLSWWILFLYLLQCERLLEDD